MKLRLRTVDNQVLTLDDKIRFVELVDDEGVLASVVYPDGASQVVVAVPGEDQYSKYCKLFKVPHHTKPVIKR